MRLAGSVSNHPEKGDPEPTSEKNGSEIRPLSKIRIQIIPQKAEFTKTPGSESRTLFSSHDVSTVLKVQRQVTYRTTGLMVKNKKGTMMDRARCIKYPKRTVKKTLQITLLYFTNCSNWTRTWVVEVGLFLSDFFL